MGVGLGEMAYNHDDALNAKPTCGIGRAADFRIGSRILVPLALH